MKKPVFIMVIVLVLSALVLAACSSAPAAPTRQPPPAAYSGKTNPLKGSADAAAKGKDLFNNLCQTCHGATGAGDGPAGAALDPKPANLVNSAAQASDAYLFWRISEGGGMAPFNSSMPAHKDSMTEDQIWQVITYIQTSFK